jgi:tRNA pseudouridine38-40 synthase
VNFRYASRTDKYVSAISNVIAFDTENTDCIIEKFNDECNNIVFYGIKKMNLDFNPRFAKKRIYRYYYEKTDIRIEHLRNILKLFIGEHNFINFSKFEANRNSIKTIDKIIIKEKEDFITIDFYAQSFLWNQIRKIISALDKSLCNKINIKDITEALTLSNKKIDFGLASSKQLLLIDILYDFNFKYDKKAIKNLNKLKNEILDNIKCQFY